MINMPRTRINFKLDLEEREIISNSEELSRDQIWNLLEKKIHEELAKRTIIFQGNMISRARCPKCTLLPPCKHYSSSEAILKDASDIFNGSEFKKVIPPNKRESLILMLKK
jgi:hypothetical protein